MKVEKTTTTVSFEWSELLTLKEALEWVTTAQREIVEQGMKEADTPEGAKRLAVRQGELNNFKELRNFIGSICGTHYMRNDA